jgi:hypothetical protein
MICQQDGRGEVLAGGHPKYLFIEMVRVKQFLLVMGLRRGCIGYEWVKVRVKRKQEGEK